MAGALAFPAVEADDVDPVHPRFPPAPPPLLALPPEAEAADVEGAPSPDNELLGTDANGLSTGHIYIF